jgi:predicted nucleic-acid-binding protein
MQIIDANIILRYLLKDNPVLFNKAAGIIEGNKEIFIPNEVVAETVYVLEKVYGV